MRRTRLLIAAALVTGSVGSALPGFAAVPIPVTDVIRRALDVGSPSFTALTPADRLVGVTWPRGVARVAIRWRTPAGWTPWADQETEPGAGGDADSGARPGTDPLWRPAGADAVGVRVDGEGVDPQLVIVRERTARRWVVGTPAAAASTTGQERLGDVVSRAEWGADESIRKRPTYTPAVDAVVVHHTINANDYTAAESPAIVRSIYAYHVRGRGFDDIGYHVLVDRFGRIFEGRFGALGRRAVKGAHAGGFNERTFGVTMIGNLEQAAPAEPMLDGVARAGAWAAERWSVDPRTSVTLTSAGSSRYAKGRRVVVRRMLGHRDVSSTVCPGAYGYPLMDELARRSWRLLAPVITDVTVEGAPVRSPEPVRIRARLTAPAQWTITVTTPYGGAVVATSEGRGDRPLLEWDGRIGGLPAAPGDYTWTATADDGIHGASTPVTGTVVVGLPALDASSGAVT